MLKGLINYMDISAFQNKIKLINDHLCDNESKDVLANRLMYSLTANYPNEIGDLRGDSYYINKVSKDYYNRLNSLFLKLKSLNKDIVIYGANKYGYDFYNFAKIFDKDLKFKYFIDMNSEQSYINLNTKCDLPIIDPTNFFNDKGEYSIVIAVFRKYDEVRELLLKSGKEEESLFWLGEKCYSRLGYFKKIPNFYPNKSESFVDCGCFNGKDVFDFINWTNNNYDNIWAYEPDTINYNKCKEALSGLDNLHINNAGVWHENSTHKFYSNGPRSSTMIDDLYNDSIKVVKLDDEIKNEKVTLIKMDIEGAEYNALTGAQNIISNQKPRLAICVYHKLEDIWELPSLLLQYRNDYKFYLRFDHFTEIEAILFAV